LEYLGTETQEELQEKIEGEIDRVNYFFEDKFRGIED